MACYGNDDTEFTEMSLDFDAKNQTIEVTQKYAIKAGNSDGTDKARDPIPECNDNWIHASPLGHPEVPPAPGLPLVYTSKNDCIQAFVAIGKYGLGIMALLKPVDSNLLRLGGVISAQSSHHSTLISRQKDLRRDIEAFQSKTDSSKYGRARSLVMRASGSKENVENLQGNLDEGTSLSERVKSDWDKSEAELAQWKAQESDLRVKLEEAKDMWEGVKKILQDEFQMTLSSSPPWESIRLGRISRFS